MADEDFLIKVGLDPSGMTEGVRRAVNESLAEINRLQKAAADDNSDARVAQLPQAASQALYSVDKSSTTELNKQKQIQQRMVEQRAKLIALAQQEASVVARAAGKTASPDQLGKIRAGGESALATSLGLDKLTPAIKGQITKVISQINAQFAPLESLSGVALQNKFRQISNEILPTVGVADKTRVRKASTIVAETDRSGVDSAVKREEEAAERSAKAAESGASDAQRSEKAQSGARRRTEKALDREAKATERRAAEAEKAAQSRVNLTKAQVPRVQKIFGEESATLNSKGSAGVFKYNQADAPALKSQVEGLLGSGDLSAVETRALNNILEQLNRDLASMQQFSAAMEAENAKQLATERRISEATQAQERAKRRGADGQEYLSVADLTNPMFKDDDGVDKIRADIRAKEAEAFAELQRQIALDEEQTRLEQEQIAQKRKGVGLLRQQNESIASQLQLTGRNRQQEELVQNGVLFGDAPEPEKVRPGTVPVDEPVQPKRKEKVQQLDFLAQELTIEDALNDQGDALSRASMLEAELVRLKEQEKDLQEKINSIHAKKMAKLEESAEARRSFRQLEANERLFPSDSDGYMITPSGWDDRLTNLRENIYNAEQRALTLSYQAEKIQKEKNDLSEKIRSKEREILAAKLAESGVSLEAARAERARQQQASLRPPREDQYGTRFDRKKKFGDFAFENPDQVRTIKVPESLPRRQVERLTDIYPLDPSVADIDRGKLMGPDPGGNYLKVIKGKEKEIRDYLNQIINDAERQLDLISQELAQYDQSIPPRRQPEAQRQLNTDKVFYEENLAVARGLLQEEKKSAAEIELQNSKQIAGEKTLTDLIETEVTIRRRAIANALVPDEVIPPTPVVPKTDVVRYNNQDAINVRSATEQEKRAHVQAYARERLRLFAEGTSGDTPIEMGRVSETTQQIALTKQEELEDARELAAAAARYGAIIEAELAQQAAIAQQTTATMENAIPITPAMLRNKVTGERTSTRENYSVRRRMAEQEEYQQVVDMYGEDIARQAQSMRRTDYPDFKSGLQESLDQAVRDFERDYVEGIRSNRGPGSERISSTGRRSSVKADPLREIRQLVQDGLAHTLGAEWDFIKDDMVDAWATPGGRMSPRLKMFEDFSKKYSLTTEPGDLGLGGEAMLVEMERIQSLREQLRTSLLSQTPLADYADRIEKLQLEAQAERQLPITAIEDDAARLNNAREQAAIANAPAGTSLYDDAEWQSVVGNAQRQMAEEWDTQVQVERDHTRALERRPDVAVPQQLPVDVDTVKKTKDDVIQERVLTDSSTFDEEERALIGALINKTNALERQTLVLTSNYDDFKTAEEALIAALNRKARALGRQTSTLDTGDGIEVGGTSRPRPQPALRSPEDIADRDAEKLRNQKAADWIRQSTALIEGDEDSLKPAELAYFKALEQQAQATQQAANETTQQVGIQQGVNDAYSGLQGMIEAMIRQNAKELADWQTAVDTRNLNAQRSRFNATPRTADLNSYDALLAQSTATLTPAQMKAAQYRKPPAALGFMSGYEKLGAPDAYEYLNPEKDAQMRLDLAIEKLEKAYLEQASLYEIITSGLADEFTDLLAAQSALTQKIKGMTNATIVDTPEFFQDYTQGAAEDKVARRQLAAGTEGVISQDRSDGGLYRSILQADLELLGLKEQYAADLAKQIANNPKLLKEMVDGIIAREEQSAALNREAMASDAAAKATLESISVKRQRKQQTEFDFLNTPEGEQFYIRQGELNERRKALREGRPEGGFGRFVGALGYKTQGASNPLGFFGGGALASLRYGLPSMLMYGAMGGVGNTFKEAEELQYNLARLEGQFESTFGDTDATFDDVRANILGVAKDTGLAADEIANLQIQLTGAFGGQTIAGVGGLELVEAQVESAAKLAQTVKLPLEEITDGLTAASLAFGASFERIGDVAVALEQESGVLARETVSFIGDIAPVAQEAGYELEEFAAIAAVAQQRSGRSGAALAESFGRVIPALTEQKDKLMELAAIEPALANDDFVDAIRASDPKAILDQIGQAYNTMSKEAQQATISLLGGRREAQAIIPAIANQPLIEEYTDAADKSAGTLEERFARVQQTLTNNLQRLGEAFRQLGVELLEAGLTDVLESAIDLLRGLAGGLSPVLNIVQEVNEAFGGWPIKILAAVAAMKIFKAFLVESSINATSGAVVNRLVGTNIALPGMGIGNGLGFRQNFRQTFQREWMARATMQNQMALAGFAPSPAKMNSLPIRGMAGGMGFGSNAIAGGKGLLSALGGGSIALGGAFIGIGALTLLYGQINSRIEADKAALADLRTEIEKDNESVDFTDNSQMEARVAQLERTADRIREEAGFLDRLWQGITGVRSEADIYLSAAERAQVPAEVTEFYGSLDPLLEERLQDQLPKLGEPTSNLRKMLRGRMDRSDGFLGTAFSTAGLYDLEEQLGFGRTGFNENEERYFNDLANFIGIERENLSIEIMNAALSPDSIDELNKLLESDDPEIANQARLALAKLRESGLGDKGFSYIYDEMQKTKDEIARFTEEQLIGENLRSAYDLGLISLNEYQAKIAQSRERRRELLQKGEKTSADEAELLRLTQEEQEDAAALAQAIIARQEKTNQIAQALGASEFKLQTDALNQGISNLQNPNITDDETRFNAALSVIEAQKQIDLDLALRSGDVNKVNELLRNGSSVPAAAQQALYEFETFEKDEWKNLAEDLQAVMDSAIDVFNDSIPKVGNRNTLFTQFGDTAEDVASSIFSEYFTMGELSEQTLQALQLDMDTLLSGLSEKGLTPEQRNEIVGSIDGLIDLLRFVGLPEQMLLDFLAGGDFSSLSEGEQNKVKADLERYMKDSPFGDKSDQQARFNQQQAFGAIESNYAPGKLSANKDAVASSIYDLAIANEQLAYVQDPKNQSSQADINAALKRQQEAENALRQAYADSASSLRDLKATRLRIAGNLVGAINEEIAALDGQIAAARAASDWVAVNNLIGQRESKVDEIRKQRVADANSLSQLNAGMSTLNGKIVEASLFTIQEAQRNLDAARTPEEINSAKLALAQAFEQLRQAQIQERQALAKVDEARTEDPVKLAKLQLAEAQRQLGEARGVVQTADAQVALINAQKALTNAMNDARYSVFNLRQAELQAMGDDVGAAQVAAELARKQLSDAIAAGAGVTAVNNARAAFISADKAAKDAVFQDRMDEYKWLLDMGRISKSQYINYLEGLKSTLIPGTKQFKDLELSIKQLKDDVGGDLQANLPTSLRLPTLYEVRRFDQTPQSGTGFGGIGYQDNRQVSVQIEINESNSAQETAGIVLKTLETAMGTGRNGYGARRI